MADNFQGASVSGGDTFAADEVGGVKYPRSKVVFGADGTATDVSSGNPLPVTLGGTAIELGATSLAALESVTATISGTVPVSGPVTDAQLRAAAVPVSGPLTDTQLRASALPVSTFSGTPAYYSLITAATNNAVKLVTGACRLRKLNFHNLSGVMQTVKLYDSNDSPPVPGTTATARRYAVYPGQMLDVDFGPAGMPFATGLGVAVVEGIANGTNSNAQAGSVLNMDWTA